MGLGQLRKMPIWVVRAILDVPRGLSLIGDTDPTVGSQQEEFPAVFTLLEQGLSLTRQLGSCAVP